DLHVTQGLPGALSLPRRGRTYTLGGQCAGEVGPDDRLVENDVRAGLARTAHERLAVTRHHDHSWPSPSVREHAPDHDITGNIRQARVGEADVEIARGRQLGRLAAAGRRDHIDTFGA